MRIGLNAQLVSLASSYRQAGVSRYIGELARQLAAEPGGHAYTVFTPPHGLGQIAPSPAMRIVPSRLPTHRPPVRIAWEQLVAPLAAARHRLDLLHAPVNVVPLALPCPAVVTVHDLAFLAYPERFRAARRRYLALMTRLSVRRAARVIAVSAHTAREVVTRLGVAPERVAVVPNAAAAHFRPEPDPAVLAAFRATHHLSKGYLLYLGTLEPRKNVTGLLRAFARIARDDPDLTLVIAGGRGWLDDEIFALHEALGLQDRVRFTGFVAAEDLPRWYQAATAFVYPSLYEGFGLPPLEAMACGTPVIISTAAALTEVVGAAGLAVAPNDDPALASALRAVLDDPARQAQMRAAGLARAATFSWSRVARETRAVYESLATPSLSGRGRG